RSPESTRTAATSSLVWPYPVSIGSNGRSNRSIHPPLSHTCSAPRTSATWSSWTRVRCQTSQAIELARPSTRYASCSGVRPSTTSTTASRTRPKASTSRSGLRIAVLPRGAFVSAATRARGRSLTARLRGPAPHHDEFRALLRQLDGQAVVHERRAHPRLVVVTVGPVNGVRGGRVERVHADTPARPTPRQPEHEHEVRAAVRLGVLHGRPPLALPEPARRPGEPVHVGGADERADQLLVGPDLRAEPVPHPR